MNIKLFIGNELADFNEVFNVMYSIGDIRDISFGSNNKSYTLNLPLTKTNKRLLKFINEPDVKSEVSSTGRLYLGDILIISGAVHIIDYSDFTAKIIINSDDWIDAIANKKLTALDLSAYDHALTATNVLNSWSAAYPFYRYPMINFGALASGETGASANWLPNDFIPMFAVSQSMTEILKPYTISSSWLATNFVKDLFVIAAEVVAENAFIENKALAVSVQAATDNQASGSSAVYIMVNLNKSLVFNTVTTDAGGDWGTDHYDVPETGTYRFRATVITSNSGYGNPNLTITDETLEISITQNGTNIANYTAPAYGGTELIDAANHSLDSGYIHCTAADVIEVKINTRVIGTVTSGTQTVILKTSATTTLFNNVWNNVNKHSGLNKNISAEELMPDITQLDFIAAIRDIFNLRFWLDKNKQVLYIEPWDQFLSSTVIDLTDYIDFESIGTEIISGSYYANQNFRWKHDAEDWAYVQWVLANGTPGDKRVTLASLFAKGGETTRESIFSSIAHGFNIVTTHYDCPLILKEEVLSGATVFDRMAGFNTRLVHWEGLATEFNWVYNSVAKTAYPKVTGLDYADATNPIYANYLMKFFHYIDKGKLFTVRMKLKPGMLMEFMTVVNTSTSEGFRPTYQITIKGVKNYFFLQKFVTDGLRAELELIIKQ